MCGEPTQEQDDPVEATLKAFAPQGDERQKSVRIAMERLAQEVKACQKKGRSSLGKKVFLKRAYKKVTHEDGKACIKLSVEAWNPFRTRVRSAELTFRTDSPNGDCTFNYEQTYERHWAWLIFAVLFLVLVGIVKGLIGG